MSEVATASALPEPTQDERTMATLAHVLQMVGGFLAPLIIFFIRRESRFVSFHALQVLFLQIWGTIGNGMRIRIWSSPRLHSSSSPFISGGAMCCLPRVTPVARNFFTSAR